MIQFEPPPLQRTPTDEPDTGRAGAVAASWPELDAIFLEDTAKTWPVTDLDVGLSCALGRMRTCFPSGSR